MRAMIDTCVVVDLSLIHIWSALSLVRIYASFIRSEATAALSIALMPFFSETLVSVSYTHLDVYKRQR